VGEVATTNSPRLVFAGTSAFAVPVLQRLVEKPYFIAGVVTQPDKPAGRGQTLQPPPVKVKALELGLPVHQPATLKNDDARNLFAALAPDLLVVVAYGKLLPPWLLALPRYGAVNLHGSLLPKYRGAAPIQWAVAMGEAATGVTTMRIDAGLDTGDILLQATMPVRASDTALTLGPRLAELGAALQYDIIAVDSAATAEHFPTASRLMHQLSDAAPLLTAQSYVVIATHGAYDEDALELALGSDAAYVALVSSRRRAAAVGEYLHGAGVAPERLARLRAPAGLDLGASEPAEIALSIMAEIVQTRRRAATEAPAPVAAEVAPVEPASAIDPVCGMTVEIATARHVADYAGQRFYFCCPGCKRSFEQSPETYLARAGEQVGA